MRGTSSHNVAGPLTGLTPDIPPISTLQPTAPAGVPLMAAAVPQQQTMEGLPAEEGALQGRDSNPADVTASGERPGQKRKRMPAAELRASHGGLQSSMGFAGLPPAPATLPQPKSARM